MRKLAYSCLGAALAALVAAPVYALPPQGSGTPSSKAAFAFAELNLVASSADGVAGIEDPTVQGPVENPAETGVKNNGDGICTFIELLDGGCLKSEDLGGPPTIIDGNGICDTEDSGKNFFGYDEAALGGCLPPDESRSFSTILRKFVKAPNGKDLWMNVSLECGNFTHTGVSSAGGVLDTSAATAMVRVRVKVTNLSTGEERFALPDGNDDRNTLPGTSFYADDGKGVVFCRRAQTLMAKFQGIIDFGLGGAATPVEAFHECIIEDPNNPGRVIIDPACLLPEELTLIVDQMQASAFNFLLPNVDSGVHQVDVEAWLDTDSFAQQGEASSAASIGLGSMIVQVLRLVKDDEGTSESAPVEIQ